MIPPRRRPMRMFAEQEIVLPNGPFAGLKFKASRQPYAAHWFDLVDSKKWQKFAFTGPSQSGKTLSAFVTPAIYHLFELKQDVIIALPNMDMAADKWSIDMFPVLEGTRYREFLPRTGRGTKGGTFSTMHFSNGATLKIMSAGGDDKSRAGYTAEVVIFTEVDGLDTVSEGSDEGTKIQQIEARTLAMGVRARIYKECTVSTESGHIWTQYDQGTRSQIAVPCINCGAWVVPDRTHLSGWHGQETKQDALEGSFWCCPSCGEGFTEDNVDAETGHILKRGTRSLANQRSKIVHRGQEIDKQGSITGDLPRTDTLGFRSSAFNNLFISAGQIGVKEWEAERAVDSTNAEKELCQFYHCLPYDDPNLQIRKLDPHTLMRRTDKLHKGVIPEWAEYITIGADTGKFLLHWTCIAWSNTERRCHVVDYGRVEVPSRDMPTEKALIVGYYNLWDLMMTSFSMKPLQIWADAGGQDNKQGFKKSIVEFSHELFEAGKDDPEDQIFRMLFGRGVAMTRKKYSEPSRVGTTVILRGDNYHIGWSPLDQSQIAEINVDYWKGWLHDRLRAKTGAEGRLTLYDSTDAMEHLSFTKHLASEHPEQEFVPEKGLMTRWVKDSSNNHWLDSTAYACTAASLCEFSLMERAL